MKLAYRVNEFMTQFGVGRQKTYDLLNAGDLEKLKCGRTTLISGASISAWMKKCVVAAAEVDEEGRRRSRRRKKQRPQL